MGAYAALVSIPYVGPALAVIAAAAAIGAGAAQIAQIAAVDAAYETGGEVVGGEQTIRVNERGPETVMNAAATARWSGILAQMNAGRFRLSERPITSSSSRMQSEAPGLLGGGSGEAASVNVAPTPVHLVVLKDQNEYRQFMESNAGKNLVLMHVRQNKDSLGLDT